MDLTWSLDYCLACDRQTSGGAYCSQSCRLADLETSTTWSDTVSPTNAAVASLTSSTDTQRGSGFYLSPAINFASYKTTPSSSSSSSSSSSPCSTAMSLVATRPQSTQSTYFSTNFTDPPSAKGLTPSSSRSSLNSNSSNDSSHTHQLSEHIHSELRAYTNAFDTTRNWRRRTWS